MANEKRMSDANDLSSQFYDIPPYIGLAGSLVKQYIDKAPTVDAVEVVHGRWEKCWPEKSKHYFRCSNCHTAYIDGISGAIAPEYGSRAWRYCPNCGAKMDGDGNG